MVSSIFRNTINGDNKNNDDAVLVTGPRISHEASGMDSIAVVENESYQNVNVSGTTGISTVNPLRRFLESSLGMTSHSSTKEREMDELNNGGRLVQIKSPIVKRDVVDSFDICREYSYSGDDDDQGQLSKLYFNDTSSTLSPSNAAILSKMSHVGTYVLGKTYHPIHDYNIRRMDESSLFWFTYRCDFPCIEPYGITSDAGWGCMLRALQMMCGQAIRLHYKSRDWRPPSGPQQRRLDPFVRSILTWFADFPSSKESIYSLHNMVATGFSKYDKLPGEWYGPGTACYVLRDIVAMHERNQKNDRTANQQQIQLPPKPIFRVHVAAGGTVYRDTIEETMTRDHVATAEHEKQINEDNHPEQSHSLDAQWVSDDLLDPLSLAYKDSLRGREVPWDTSLLLLIPLRLGLKSFNNDYIEAVSFTFSLPQSVGVLGGRPRGARWFYGALSDGSKIFGLDPHTVQAAPKRRTALMNGVQSSIVDLSDDYMRSVHTTYPEVFSLSKMDPSIALGFYCRGRDDLESVFASIQSWKRSHPKSPDLFTVADQMPQYSVHPTSLELSAIEDKNSSIEADEEDNDDEDGNATDDDEFIML